MYVHAYLGFPQQIMENGQLLSNVIQLPLDCLKTAVEGIIDCVTQVIMLLQNHVSTVTPLYQGQLGTQPTCP